MKIAAFYHCYVGGAWQEPRAEFETALADFDGPLHVFEENGPSEAPTLNSLLGYAQSHEGAVLYAHTKGASHPGDEFRARWRRSMTLRVVTAWQYNLEWLESGDFDAVGCHWITHEAFHDMLGPAVSPGFFAGNFWLATTAYLRNLPECASEPRWEAEQWIGRNHPRVVDLLPGWPHDNRWTEICV